VLALLLTAALAEEPLARHRDLAEAAVRAERSERIADAVAACTAAIELLPDGPRAPRCRERLVFLAARQDADGSWRSWERLQRVRDGWRRRPYAESRDEVTAMLAAEGVALATRAEGTLWLARDSLDRLGAPELALSLSSALYADRARLEPALRTTTVLLHAEALAKLGRIDEALGVEAEVRVAAAHPRPTPVDEVAWRATLDRAGSVAAAAIALWSAAAVPAAIVAVRRGVGRPGLGGLGILAAVAIPTWAIVHAWDDGADDGLPPMLAAFVAIHLVSALARGATSGAARAGLGVLAALATAAAAFLALDASRTLAWVLR
jgi:hypothetical protein